MRALNARLVRHNFGIEQNKISPHPGANDATVLDAGVRRGQGSHLAYCFLEHESALLANIPAEHPGKSTEAAGMGGLQ